MEHSRRLRSLLGTARSAIWRLTPWARARLHARAWNLAGSKEVAKTDTFGALESVWCEKPAPLNRKTESVERPMTFLDEQPGSELAASSRNESEAGAPYPQNLDDNAAPKMTIKHWSTPNFLSSRRARSQHVIKQCSAFHIGPL